MKKLTKMNKYEMMLVVLENGNDENKEMLMEFVQHEMDLLAKKNSTKGDRKPTKVQLENEGHLESIRIALNDNKARTISEMQSENDELSELSNQKMSALLKKLVDNGEVEKFVEKKKTYFKMKNEQ